MAYTALEEGIYQWFHAIPKEAPAIFALVFIFLFSCINLAITFKTRSWFMLIVAFTAGLEVAGYICRVVMLHQPGYGAYVIMQALLIISPIFLALVDYSAVGRLIRVADGGGRMRPGWVAKLFFASDILCLAIQGGGAGLSSSKTATQSSINTAKALLLIGLILQLAFFTAFTAITIYINLNRTYGLRGVKQYKPVFLCIYLTIFLLYVRGVFRVIEFSDGWYGKIATTETYFYVFDFSMIALCFVIFTVLHFGFHLKKVAGALPVMASQSQKAAANEVATKEAVAMTNVHAF